MQALEQVSNGVSDTWVTVLAWVAICTWLLCNLNDLPHFLLASNNVIRQKTFNTQQWESGGLPLVLSRPVFILLGQKIELEFYLTQILICLHWVCELCKHGEGELFGIILLIVCLHISEFISNLLILFMIYIVSVWLIKNKWCVFVWIN